MNTEKLIMDGITYRVRAIYDSRKRHFELVSGKNAGKSIGDTLIRDLSGTGYAYQMSIEPDPAYPEDYDLFYDAISAPVDYHMITVPYGQTTMTYKAAVFSGDDVDGGVLGNKRRWHGLIINFAYFEPQRRT